MHYILKGFKYRSNRGLQIKIFKKTLRLAIEVRKYLHISSDNMAINVYYLKYLGPRAVNLTNI